MHASSEALAPLAADSGQGSFIVMLVSPRNALPTTQKGTNLLPMDIPAAIRTGGS